jgi:predicted metal-binding membrane protein
VRPNADHLFLAFAVLLVAGFLAIWWPLGLLAGASVALVASIAMARAATDDE